MVLVQVDSEGRIVDSAGAPLSCNSCGRTVQAKDEPFIVHLSEMFVVAEHTVCPRRLELVR